jgi:hypothetical protein
MLVSCECCVLSGIHRSLRRDDPSSRGILPSAVFLSVISYNSHHLHLQWVGRRGQKKKKAFDIAALVLVRREMVTQRRRALWRMDTVLYSAGLLTQETAVVARICTQSVKCPAC